MAWHHADDIPLPEPMLSKVRYHPNIILQNLSHIGLVMLMATLIWVNIGSGKGLLPDGTRPLPEPMLTDQPWNLVTYTWGNFTGNTQDIYPWYGFETPRGQWVNILQSYPHIGCPISCQRPHHGWPIACQHPPHEWPIACQHPHHGWPIACRQVELSNVFSEFTSSRSNLCSTFIVDKLYTISFPVSLYKGSC